MVECLADNAAAEKSDTVRVGGAVAAGSMDVDEDAARLIETCGTQAHIMNKYSAWPGEEHQKTIPDVDTYPYVETLENAGCQV